MIFDQGFLFGGKKFNDPSKIAPFTNFESNAFLTFQFEGPSVNNFFV